MPSLAEDLMLLLLDDESGRPAVDRATLEKALAGAVLLELAISGRVSPAEAGGDARKGQLLVQDGSTTGDPVLDSALSRLAAKPVTARKAVELLVKGTREAVLAGLSERGLIRVEEAKVLGVFPRTSWPAVDGEHESQVRGGLAAVLLHEESPKPHIGGLISLLHAIGAVHKVVEGDRKQVRKRAKEVSEGNWASAAVKEAIQYVQASMIAVIFAAGATATG